MVYYSSLIYWKAVVCDWNFWVTFIRYYTSENMTDVTWRSSDACMLIAYKQTEKKNHRQQKKNKKKTNKLKSLAYNVQSVVVLCCCAKLNIVCCYFAEKQTTECVPSPCFHGVCTPGQSTPCKCQNGYGGYDCGTRMCIL